MQKIIALILIALVLCLSCSKDRDDTVVTVNTTFNFIHSWDGEAVDNADFNDLKFTNQNGEVLSIERLRYLISNITFTTTSGERFTLTGYNLVDVTNDENLSYTPVTKVPVGDYSDVSFTFGFTNDENNQTYTDLNSVSWSVPELLGGGYHYMQLDGKFLNSTGVEQGYNYHAIRAVDATGDSPSFPQDTFFNVGLGAITVNADTAFTINMNIAEWFKNPNTWDLNVLNQMLMPNASAQIMIHDNGQSVFSLTATEQQ